jgi:putative SOS response-associated peptidase YedK
VRRDAAPRYGGAMCNLYTQSKSVDEVARVFRELQMPLGFPEGIPNLQPTDIRITDPGPIVRAGAGGGGLEMVVRRWSWPGPSGKPVYNFRSEGREFPSGRCLIVADGFYEFTTPADPKQKRKDKWLFTDPDQRLLGIAGLVREMPGIGQAFTMLTSEPGPDVAPYHGRQVAVLKQHQWGDWLDPLAEVKGLIGPLPGGTLVVRQVN